MLMKLRPRLYVKYTSLPVVGPFLDEFTDWSQGRGYAVGTIENQLMAMRRIVPLLQKRGIDCAQDLTHGHFEEAWKYFRHDHPGIAGTVRQLQRFFDYTNRLPPRPSLPKTDTDRELENFAIYLEKVRGLATTTIHAYLSYLRRFLDGIAFDSNMNSLAELSLTQIEAFLHECARTLNRYSLQHVVAYLRSFLCFQYSRGAIKQPIHQMIDTPRIYRLEKLPCSLSWATVNELLLSIDRVEPQGIRNYAMLFLIATYGLRSCEVVSLKLDDIDWRGSKIRVDQGKTGTYLMLPLTDPAASAIIDYLKNARPNLPYRQVFLRIRAPYGTLKATAVTEAFQRQVKLSGIAIPYQGPHCLRHSYAVHLLREGSSVKVIGDLLGHRNAESTCVYLRLAIDDLRGVALEVPDHRDENIRVDATALKDIPPVRSLKKVKASTPVQSFLAQQIKAYLEHHRSLGKEYGTEETTLRSLDAFLATGYPEAKDLDGTIFNKWGETFAHLMPTVRRNRMRMVRNFCLYRLRSHPQCFVPDILTFPAEHPPFIPYILTPSDIGRLLGAARSLSPTSNNPLRSHVIRLAIILLYTCGLRRGELLRLTLGDYDSVESTLFVRSTKFHKERLVPLSRSADGELRAYLRLRQRSGLPIKESSPILFSRVTHAGGRAYTGTGLAWNWRVLCASLKISNSRGVPPRVHDIRHSFAVNALLRWYQNDEDVQAKLPQLSTFMGHGSIVSTECYLPFVEPLRSAASTRFEHKYGHLIPDKIDE